MITSVGLALTAEPGGRPWRSTARSARGRARPGPGRHERRCVLRVLGGVRPARVPAYGGPVAEPRELPGWEHSPVDVSPSGSATLATSLVVPI